MKLRIIVATLTGLIFLCGCKKDLEIITDVDQVNKWVYKVVKENYLWSAELPNRDETDLYMQSSDYFNSYLRFRYDHSVYYAYDIYGDRFSRVTSSSSSTRAHGNNFQEAVFNSDKVYNHGLYVGALVSGSQVVQGLIYYVKPDSPASEAGIERGYSFTSINGVNMPMSYDSFESQMSSATLRLGFNYPTVQTISVGSASYSDTPIIHSEVISEISTGYLVYTSFKSGNSGIFSTALKEVFRRFKNEGVRNIVVDLRYNGGGQLSVATLLTSLLAPQSRLNTPYIYLEENSTFGKPDNFKTEKILPSSEVSSYMPNVENVYLLTSANTASASELVIHAMRAFPEMNINMIGNVTYGKNLGTVDISNPQYKWVITPVTLKVYDLNKVSGYEEGLEPDVMVTRELLLDYASTGQVNTLAPFGDYRNDPLLKAAVNLISPGLVSSSSSAETRGGVYYDTKFRTEEDRLMLEPIIIY